MARITVNDVEDLYKPRPDQDLNVSIKFAENLVTAVLLSAGHTDAQLADIQAWLAAGFASVLNPPISSGSGRNRSVQYEGSGKNRYFETAFRLDSSGLLAKVFSPKGKRRAQLHPLFLGQT